METETEQWTDDRPHYTEGRKEERKGGRKERRGGGRGKEVKKEERKGEREEGRKGGEGKEEGRKEGVKECPLLTSNSSVGAFPAFILFTAVKRHLSPPR